MRSIAALLVLFLTACASHQTSAPTVSPATTPEEADLVDLRTLVPDIDLDIRYAGANNFTGAPVDGYDAPKCYLLRPAAEALAAIERGLRDDHLRLRLYDCYRPVRAVRRFVEWAHAPEDGRTKAAYYPSFDKPDLLGDYISPTSGHSRGATVDLDLLECDDTGVSCTPLDMGTHFDFFDTLANTESRKATDAQRANRHRLRDAMQAGGFRDYKMEWWHFTLDPAPSPGVAFDIPVR
ncbi:D-alanyl-D-alanine dipeptidase [Lysobacter dokdonensis DS-58]|uniref:D-alanyl-D-alanine dipeptidase n=1 Tax=Lysobacter dokdonensis DS-58 TaxID=1300345 RepID=A0A0A2WLU3_9GAMM|nr:M15 family metallopeptidase [Lysobacter dokdonensis]KGQ20783.1 D-alanyl-D-alanine dipeptidase [Lysobacter dokdonensis DS-58]